MIDAFTGYEVGLESFKKQIDKESEGIQELYVFEARLRENIQRARLVGDSDQSRSDRAQILDQLNQLALREVGVSFNELCRSVITPLAPVPTTTNDNLVSQAIFKQVEQGAIERNAITDKPVQSLEEDRLGFADYVCALRDFIASQDTSTPLTIGIDGPWGTGKTSLMRMLQNELDPSLNFWTWLWLKWFWLKWFFPFLWTLLPWMYGKLRLWVDEKATSLRRLRAIDARTKYDISDENKVDVTQKTPLLDLATLNKTGGPRRFQEIRATLLHDSDAKYEFSDEKALKIRAGLSYDPSIVDIRLDDLKDPIVKFWAKIAAQHCSMIPLTCPTVWFNAWKFSQEEQLWAALALEVMNQIKLKYNFWDKIIFWLRLTFKRFSLIAALWNIANKMALPILLGLCTLLYGVYIKQLSNSSLVSLVPLGQPLLLVGAIVSGVLQVASIIKDPFQIQINDVFNKPDYKNKVGFIGSFEEDFSHIVSLATQSRIGWKPQKLVIFIDDLDRCDVPKAVDIIEGINLFLDSERCVFVLGMNSTAVIASIEAKYKDLFEKMQQEDTSVGSVGRLFLDKIIQVPLHIPLSFDKNEDLPGVLNGIIKQKDNLLTNFISRSQHSPVALAVEGSILIEESQIDRASYIREDVREAINKGSVIFKKNPRQVKRFINLFRLYVYIADKRRLFEEYKYGEREAGLSLKRLAIWVAWSIRWNELARLLFEELQMPGLQVYLMQIAECLQEDGSWIARKSVADLSPYENLISVIMQTRDREKNSPSHWCHLPWQWWLQDLDFLRCIKEMECFWYNPEKFGIDWLQNMLRMTKITFSANNRVSQVIRKENEKGM